jgi:hypothetical protein
MFPPPGMSPPKPDIHRLKAEKDAILSLLDEIQMLREDNQAREAELQRLKQSNLETEHLI